ncbi:MAG: YjbQ family protein [Candidatus Micrarchaeota archaeon]|nr:YjbQ family protein [Candidatus Micrarchaeota archaeon]
MKIKTVELHFKKDTNGMGFVDITRPVEHSVVDSKMKDGIATIHSTDPNVCITTLDNEIGNITDVKAAFERIAPSKAHSPGEKHSDVRPSIVGPGITIPFKDNRIIIGKWQQIFMIDFDGMEKPKKVVVQIMGE